MTVGEEGMAHRLQYLPNRMEARRGRESPFTPSGGCQLGCLLRDPGVCGGSGWNRVDMWKPFIAAVKKWVPGAGEKIAFDKFHVAAHLGKAVDDVRRREHRELDAQGESPLKGTKFLWLRNPLKMSRERTREFAPLRDSALRTARAWALKEAAMDLWHYVSHGWAHRQWKAWIGWALRSRLEPVMRVGRMVRDHLWGILNAVVLGVTNAMSESVNSKIQWVKRLACGYRNRERYRNAIYFHLGGLDLYPGTLRATHTGS